MKQKLMIFVLMFVLGTVGVDAQPKHRHHAVATTAKDSTTIVAKPSADEGIEAYSDTTSVADDEFDEDEDAMVPNVKVSHDPDDYDDPISWLESFKDVSLGAGGVALVIVGIIFLLLIIFSPFIILALVLRYLIRRHNDRVTLAEKAMESGRPIPDELMEVDKQSDDYLRRRGIRNIWLGIGMVIMFGIWSSDMLMGIGFLILCYGIGQIFIARSSKGKD